MRHPRPMSEIIDDLNRAQARVDKSDRNFCFLMGAAVGVIVTLLSLGLAAQFLF